MTYERNQYQENVKNDYLGIGKHDVKIVEFEKKYTQKGDDWIIYTLQDKSGKSIRINFFMTEKAGSRLFAFADMCNVKTDKLNVEDLIDKYITIIVEEGTNINKKTGSHFMEVISFEQFKGVEFEKSKQEDDLPF